MHQQLVLVVRTLTEMVWLWIQRSVSVVNGFSSPVLRVMLFTLHTAHRRLGCKKLSVFFGLESTAVMLSLMKLVFEAIAGQPPACSKISPQSIDAVLH